MDKATVETTSEAKGAAQATPMPAPLRSVTLDPPPTLWSSMKESPPIIGLYDASGDCYKRRGDVAKEWELDW